MKNLNLLLYRIVSLFSKCILSTIFRDCLYLIKNFHINVSRETKLISKDLISMQYICKCFVYTDKNANKYFIFIQKNNNFAFVYFFAMHCNPLLCISLVPGFTTALQFKTAFVYYYFFFTIIFFYSLFFY